MTKSTLYVLTLFILVWVLLNLVSVDADLICWNGLYESAFPYTLFGDYKFINDIFNNQTNSYFLFYQNALLFEYGIIYICKWN